MYLFNGFILTINRSHDLVVAKDAQFPGLLYCKVRHREVRHAVLGFQTISQQPTKLVIVSFIYAAQDSPSTGLSEQHPSEDDFAVTLFPAIFGAIE